MNVVEHSKSMTDQIVGDVPDDKIELISEEQRNAVRRLCAANAQGDTLAEQVADAELLMMTLGIHRSQSPPAYAVDRIEAPLNRMSSL